MMTMIPRAMARDSNADTILTLPEHAGALEIAQACRETAQMFVDDSHHWGVAELATWLMGPYAMVAHDAPTCARRRGGAARPGPTLLREIDPRMVGRMIATARTQVLDTLDGLTTPREVSAFARRMVAAGFVTRCLDLRGVSGWVPTTEAQRLADRVLSLLAADFLAGSSSHEPGLSLWDSVRGCRSEVPTAGPASGCVSRQESAFVGLHRRPSQPLPEGA